MKKIFILITLFSINTYSNPASQWYQEETWSGSGIWPFLLIIFGIFLCYVIYFLIVDFFEKDVPKDEYGRKIKIDPLWKKIIIDVYEETGLKLGSKVNVRCVWSRKIIQRRIAQVGFRQVTTEDLLETSYLVATFYPAIVIIILYITVLYFFLSV